MTDAEEEEVVPQHSLTPSTIRPQLVLETAWAGRFKDGGCWTKEPELNSLTGEAGHRHFVPPPFLPPHSTMVPFCFYGLSRVYFSFPQRLSLWGSGLPVSVTALHFCSSVYPVSPTCSLPRTFLCPHHCLLPASRKSVCALPVSSPPSGHSPTILSVHPRKCVSPHPSIPQVCVSLRVSSFKSLPASLCPTACISEFFMRALAIWEFCPDPLFINPGISLFL